MRPCDHYPGEENGPEHLSATDFDLLSSMQNLIKISMGQNFDERQSAKT